MKTRDVSNATMLPGLEIQEVLVLGNKECLHQRTEESRHHPPSQHPPRTTRKRTILGLLPPVEWSVSGNKPIKKVSEANAKAGDMSINLNQVLLFRNSWRKGLPASSGLPSMFPGLAPVSQGNAQSQANWGSWSPSYKVKAEALQEDTTVQWKFQNWIWANHFRGKHLNSVYLQSLYSDTPLKK